MSYESDEIEKALAKLRGIYESVCERFGPGHHISLNLADALQSIENAIYYLRKEIKFK